MSDTPIFPSLGQSLRYVITQTGYRPFIESIGLDKNLDDVAYEKRGGVNFELLCDVKQQWLDAVSVDCGPWWGEQLESAWERFQDVIQFMVGNVDAYALNTQAAREMVSREVLIPELSGFIKHVSSKVPVVDLDTWWESPFAAWISCTADMTQQADTVICEQLESHLDVDARSIQRWLTGAAIGKSLWPYGETVLAAVGQDKMQSLSDREREKITGWLMLATAVQSLPEHHRKALKDYCCNYKQTCFKSAKEIAVLIMREGFDFERLPIDQMIGATVRHLNHLYEDFELNKREILRLLEHYKRLLSNVPPDNRSKHEFIFYGYSAMYYARIESPDQAMAFYIKAVNGAWWRAGRRQQTLLRQALVYAVGIGDKVRAGHLWDKCYLLGLNRPPKKDLDQQELRKLSMAFEKMFYPLKSVYRVPPAFDIVVDDKPFSVSKNDLRNPNQKKKFAEGRTRRTPFMNAVREGQLSDVIKVYEAGGDPNDYIPESGEGPFIYALRRAYDRKDPAILDYFLSLPLSKETLNRAASTKKETPLKVALEMGDASIVRKLMVLGADIEQTCFHAPSALCYALFLLHDSIWGEKSESRAFYYAGLTPGDGFDAKAGAVLDADISRHRQGLLELQKNPIYQNIVQAIRAYYFRPVMARKEVIMALLEYGADANRCYQVHNRPRDAWTPTLYAAQLGDIEIFESMLAAGGNPDHVLQETSLLDRKDAMWVAVAYKRHSIIEHLKQRRSFQ